MPVTYVLIFKDGRGEKCEFTTIGYLSEYLLLFADSKRYPKSENYRKNIAQGVAEIANPFVNNFDCEDFELYKERM